MIKKKGFKKVEFFEPNIQNSIISTRAIVENLTKIFKRKENLINETVNGLVNIFNITETVEDFKKISYVLPEYLYTDPGSICKLTMIINKRL